MLRKTSKGKAYQLRYKLVVIVILGLGLVGAYEFGFYQAGRKSLVISQNFVKPTPLRPIPTLTPTMTLAPTNSPVPIPKGPSDRALRVAGTVYALYKDEADREKIRQMAGISKSNDNTEIIQLALYYDKNPGTLARLEAAIEDYKLRQSRTNLPLPPAPINCYSNTIGGSTYTNCH